MTTLSQNEATVLKALKDGREKGLPAVCAETGLGADGARRGIFFLSQKGLVLMNVKESKGTRITEKGQAALKDFPDLRLLGYGGKSVKDVPQGLAAFLGPMKQFGYISLENGKIKPLGKDTTAYPLLKALKSPDKADAPSVSELRRRGYIEIFESKDISAKITEQGKGTKLDETVGAKSLTAEMITSGSWKGASFPKLNIAPDTVPMQDSGKTHPITNAIDRIKEIFISMGFEEMEGNYVEEAFWNFDALFQPQDHPSRELADTFYINKVSDLVDASKEEAADPIYMNKSSRLADAPKNVIGRAKSVHEEGWHCKWDINEAKKTVLRTHTTVLSARTLAKRKRGKFFAIGRVFRNEAIDFKHLAEFHQVEGIIADESVTFRQLLGVLKTFYSRLGFEKVRFRPSYFPYTEPSLEIEVFFEPRKEWIEIGGAGIFRPEVCEILGCVYPVLAFGLSLERPLMMILGTNDIRAFYNNDLDFLKSVKRDFIGKA
jgi:phenylalanyl-tRNA synthetase alpha chain